MLDEQERDVLRELFVKKFYTIAEEIHYEEKLWPPSNFLELCSKINLYYLRVKPSASQFIEFLELYIEFFKEKTDIKGD